MVVNIDNRMLVLKTALLIESMTTIFLAELIEVKDYQTSKSFSGSSALSLNHRVNLLIDMGALTSEQKKPLLKFMEIRNTFMHDLEASTYEKCVRKIEGCENWLFNKYNTDPSLDKEERLKIAIEKLCNEVLGFIKDLIDAIKKKFLAKIEIEMTQKANDAFITLISDITKELNTKIEQLMEEGNPSFNSLINLSKLTKKILGYCKVSNRFNDNSDTKRKLKRIEIKS